MSYQGDLAEDAILYFSFTTRFAGVPATLGGTPALSVYKDDNLTQSVAGVTLSVDHDGVTGFNNVVIDTSADAFYVTGSDYTVVITTGTVGGNSVVGEVVGTFSIENRFGLADITNITETSREKLLGQFRWILALAGGNKVRKDHDAANEDVEYYEEDDTTLLLTRRRTVVAAVETESIV